MDSFSLGLVAVSTLVLLPIIPAFLLFKLLKSSAVVTGPFSGLTLNLGGAFAAYFVIFLLIRGRMPKPPDDVEYYTLTGKLVLPDPKAPAYFGEGSVAMTVMPRDQYVFPDGRFRTRFPFDPERKGESPTILINAGACGSASVPIEIQPRPGKFGLTYDLTISRAERLITATKPVQLMLLSPTPAALDSSRRACRRGS